jgi:uncharacterized protein YndB with AHSA1/START domain
MVHAKSSTPALSDENVKTHTGKSWKEWFKALDEVGGPGIGRKGMGDFLFKQCKVDPWWTATITVEYENARGVTQKDGKAMGYNICVTKGIAAPLEKVFGAFSKTSELDKWFSKKSKQDFKVGGRFENADGDSGEFVKIRENKDLKFTWENPRHAPGSLVEIKVQASGNKTNVVVTHDRIQKRDDADGLRIGWMFALESLKVYLEKGATLKFEDWQASQKR